MRLKFTKMQGAGNDFVVLDATRAPIDLSAGQLRQLGDRRFGVGADQILVVEPARRPGVDFGYRIFNNSGDEVEHCGNGARCFVRFVHDQGLTTQRRITVETVNTVLVLQLQDDGRVTVDMNLPLFALAALPFEPRGLVPQREGDFERWPLALGDGRTALAALLSMGNPHAVLRVDDVANAPVASLGPLVQACRGFVRGVNVGFMQLLSRREIALRVYERGVGETLACGTGACAAVVAGIRLGWLDRHVDVQARGGVLTIAWPADDAHVQMTGPAETVFEGEITL